MHRPDRSPRATRHTAPLPPAVIVVGGSKNNGTASSSQNATMRVNDIHSGLNATRVSGIATPRSVPEVVATVRAAGAAGQALSICGARHAMGGQQFGGDTLLLDLTGLSHVGRIDRARGTVECGAGVTWPNLIQALHQQQANEVPTWSIRQKQTGADNLTVGGALSANAHGRGLRMRPIIDDVESFSLVTAAGELLHCSRHENGELFGLAIGGYGCFGVIVSVQLRLSRRRKLERRVEVITLDALLPKLEARVAAGFLYGDFQFAIDAKSADFLNRGVLSCYAPVDDAREMSTTRRDLQPADWQRLLHLAHSAPSEAFKMYVGHYLATDGQLYWSDTHQLTIYVDHYHEQLDAALGASVKATEMITELYVPRTRLVDFMQAAAAELRPRGVPVIYGTIRFIERDTESFLAWAREDWACVVFNLHTEHSPGGIERAAEAFRALIDVALSLGGTYFLTYHRWARRDQVERGHPQFAEFLERKDFHDPEQRFQSDWWRHYRAMFPRG